MIWEQMSWSIVSNCTKGLSILSKLIYQIWVIIANFSLRVIVITGSADKTIKLIDIESGFKEFGTMKTTDAVYCMETIHNLTLAGTGDGNILCYDNDTLECLYG